MINVPSPVWTDCSERGCRSSLLQLKLVVVTPEGIMGVCAWQNECTEERGAWQNQYGRNMYITVLYDEIK